MITYKLQNLSFAMLKITPDYNHVQICSCCGKEPAEKGLESSKTLYRVLGDYGPRAVNAIGYKYEKCVIKSPMCRKCAFPPTSRKENILCTILIIAIVAVYVYIYIYLINNFVDRYATGFMKFLDYAGNLIVAGIGTGVVIFIMAAIAVNTASLIRKLYYRITGKEPQPTTQTHKIHKTWKPVYIMEKLGYTEILPPKIHPAGSYDRKIDYVKEKEIMNNMREEFHCIIK